MERFGVVKLREAGRLEQGGYLMSLRLSFHICEMGLILTGLQRVGNEIMQIISFLCYLIALWKMKAASCSL